MFLKKKYPYNSITSILLVLYKSVWILLFPLVIVYFLKRSIKEPNYRKNLSERLGFGKSFLPNSIWIHAVSLGEFRASVPLIKRLLERSERILLTTITPAGREEAQKVLKFAIEAGNVHLVYFPLEYDLAFNKFLSRYRPYLAIVLEIELWPVMISACSKYDVPLVLAQGQYVEKRVPWLRGALFNGFDLILAKSEVHAARYQLFCNNPVDVMGELRFDQTIPEKHLNCANLFLRRLNLKKSSRVCFCLGSTGPGEDADLILLINQLNARAKEIGIPKPFYVYVPRHKKDFFRIAKALDNSGLKFLKRSDIFDQNLKLKSRSILKGSEIDGIFGDSLGEISFYFQMADYVFIGNSFNNLGSHNIIEPLALKKSVVVGPSVWGIEYPIVEALEAGIIKKVQNVEELYDYWLSQIESDKKIYERKALLEEFYNIHSGASERCISKLQEHGFLTK
jgi:3-deoxy-D-manno-octulosonic-acid transferase